MLLRRRLLYDRFDKNEYVRNGMLLYLDGRDAPVNGAWVDRMNNTRCAITGTLNYLSNERCYYKSESGAGYVTLPNELLLNNYLYTVQAVGKVVEMGNQAYVAIHSHQNTSTQFSIWHLPLGTSEIRIQYYTYSNGVNFYGYGKTVNPDEIHSMSGSRNGGSTCKSFISGTFHTMELAAMVATNDNGNTLFKCGGWNEGKIKIHCIRIYNRVLSNREILHNYKLDKEIFNSV